MGMARKRSGKMNEVEKDLKPFCEVPVKVQNVIKEFVPMVTAGFRKGGYDFDLLRAAMGRVNENGHTKVLAELLKTGFVCESFFRFLDRCFLGRGFNEIITIGFDNARISCFERWMDLYITVGDYKIIVENKVNGACDQDRQIDRYVSEVKKHGVGADKIFVLYLTAFGGFPSEESLKETKEILDCDKADGGRLFAISYLREILSWLNEIIGRCIENNLPAEKRDVFRSGLVQYRHHIEGPSVLGLREDKDGYDPLRSKINVLSNAEIVNLCNWGYFDWLYRRQVLCRNCSETGDIYERKQQYKTIFYRAFDRVVGEGGFYDVVSLKNGHLLASLSCEDGFGDSLVQINVWGKNSACIDPLLNADKVHAVLDKCIERDLVMNGCPMVRFHVADLDQLFAVLETLGVSGVQNPKSSAEDVFSSFKNYKTIVEVLWECAKKYYNRAASSRTDDKNQCFEMWNEIQGVNHNYWYENEWAIQLYEDSKTLVKAIDVFGSRNVTDKEVASLQSHILGQEMVYPYQCLSWNGRVFFRFPVPTKEYAEHLVDILKAWRNKQERLSKLS